MKTNFSDEFGDSDAGSISLDEDDGSDMFESDDDDDDDEKGDFEDEDNSDADISDPEDEPKKKRAKPMNSKAFQKKLKNTNSKCLEFNFTNRLI